MQLSKRAIFIVIGLASLALVGLSVLQIQNLRSSLKTNKQIFLQKVDLAASKISKEFLINPYHADQLRKAQARILHTDNLKDPIMDKHLRSIFAPIFEEHGIDLSYEYAVFMHKNDSEGFNYVMGNNGESLEFQLVSCDNPKERGHGWANLTCSSGGNLHLALFFPDQEAYVFAQSRGALIMSVIFIVLLIGCFAYTLIVIRKQKRLSLIKNDFINNLTHEFKTPIASIALATSMLKNDKPEIEKRKKANYLNLIELEAKRLEGQVDKVLQIAMIDSGNFTLEKKRLDVHDVIQRVVESMELMVSKRKGAISLHLNATQSEVMADGTHLVNIIYNLIDNALKYTIDVPKIAITTSDHAQGIEISIQDNGIGIGKEIQRYIFDKFYRAESGNIQNAKGFGLGLSYVKKIIEEHKGRIDLSSTLNQGSEFRLYFPFS
ncbi:sensor histidine kinase [Ekhidna sp. To15]|uniref:sensor histidine kinase n=1 Tax=Ekhidna sp. To15 TaxID=3395267 RepID=UPI003F524E36